MFTQKLLIKVLAITCLTFFYTKGFSQTASDNFLEIKKIINKINPEEDFYGKVVFVSVWKSTDFESRETNKEAYRVYKIYEKAKLKNGEKGTVFISLNLDENSQNKDFSITKDEINPNNVYSNTDLWEILKKEYGLASPQNNILIDKTGAIQLNNISKENIFSSFRSLIIR